MSSRDLFAFADYLNDRVKLEELQKMSESLDDEMADARRAMMEIKKMSDSIPTLPNAELPNAELPNAELPNDDTRFEEWMQYLNQSPPQLLMPDMLSPKKVDVDLNDIIAKIKEQIEELQKNVVNAQLQPRAAQRSVGNVDFGAYAACLDKFSKKLANIKLYKNYGGRNAELETKLELLCSNVNMFTQMVEANETLNESHTPSAAIPDTSDDLKYEELLSKLSTGIDDILELLNDTTYNSY